MGDARAKKAKKEKKEKKEKKAKKAKKRARDSDADDDARRDEKPSKSTKSTESDGGGGGDADLPHPAPGTFPTSATQVYMGNLAWTIDEESLGEAFADCGEIVSVNWFEEKATGKFLGAGVVEFATPEAAAKAVAASGRVVHKRETPTRFWEKRGNTAEERAAAKAASRGGKAEIKPLGPKPSGCYTLFMGNLNFQIDDDAIWQFFMDNAGVEPTTVRWLTNKDTGEFRGVGFADFAEGDIDKAAATNGKPCMGRPIRLDWQAPSNRG